MALGTHVQLLAAELRRFGFTKPAAATLSSEVVLRHPIVHRVGVKKLTRRFMRHGLATEDATHLALSLWGLERFQLGARFQDLRNTLRRAGVEDSDALAACLEARRLLRDTAAGVPGDEADIQLARWCLVLLATLLLVSALLQLGL